MGFLVSLDVRRETLSDLKARHMKITRYTLSLSPSTTFAEQAVFLEVTGVGLWGLFCIFWSVPSHLSFPPTSLLYPFHAKIPPSSSQPSPLPPPFTRSPFTHPIPSPFFPPFLHLLFVLLLSLLLPPRPPPFTPFPHQDSFFLLLFLLHY